MINEIKDLEKGNEDLEREVQKLIAQDEEIIKSDLEKREQVQADHTKQMNYLK